LQGREAKRKNELSGARTFTSSLSDLNANVRGRAAVPSPWSARRDTTTAREMCSQARRSSESWEERATRRLATAAGTARAEMGDAQRIVSLEVRALA
jgi:hypothetical protein